MLKKDQQDTLICSFCKKTQHDVEKLIAGPDVYICDACVVGLPGTDRCRAGALPCPRPPHRRTCAGRCPPRVRSSGSSTAT